MLDNDSICQPLRNVETGCAAVLQGQNSLNVAVAGLGSAATVVQQSLTTWISHINLTCSDLRKCDAVCEADSCEDEDALSDMCPFVGMAADRLSSVGRDLRENGLPALDKATAQAPQTPLQSGLFLSR